MIKANELRVGNWVHHLADWSNRQPEGAGSAFPLHEFDFQWTEQDWYWVGECCLSLENIAPIPLTEEWLLRFGFKKPASSWIGDKIHLSEWDEYPFTWCVAFNANSAVLQSKLKYVHQLQNLFYALTGQELESK